MIIIIVLLAIIIVCWVVLTIFLKQYEKSQPDNTIKEFITTIDDEKTEKMCESILDQLSDLQDDSLIVSNLKNTIANSTAVEYSPESNTNQVVYYLYDGSQYIAKVTLIPGDNMSFGFKKWIVSDAEVLDSLLSDSITINVPKDYTLYFEDTPLVESYVIGDKIEYEMLDGFYSEKGINLPYLSSYVTGSVIGDVKIYGKDSNDNIIPYEDLNEDTYCNNCDKNTKVEVSQFTKDFIYAYVKFLSNSDRNTEGNYTNLIQYVESNSSLESLLRDAKKSNGFNSSLGDQIESINILHCMDCGNNLYMCDSQFTYISTGQHREQTEMTNNMKLLIRFSSDSSYKAIAMVQY